MTTLKVAGCTRFNYREVHDAVGGRSLMVLPGKYEHDRDIVKVEFMQRSDAMTAARHLNLMAGVRAEIEGDAGPILYPRTDFS